MRITVHPAIQLNHLSIPAIHHSLICLIFCLLLGWTGFAEAGLDFAAVPGNTTGLHPESVAAADLNGDGKPDLVTANSGSNTVSVFLGNGDGSFQARTDYPVGGSPESITVADLNGDGHPDLATANRDDNTVSVLVGNGEGGFQARADFGVGHSPSWLAAGDLNGDGKPELVTANGASHTVSVLLNTSTEGPSPVLGPIAPFDGQTVGTTSSARDLTLSNTGTAAFELQSVTASGDFAVSHDCGGSLAPGASCTLQVTFTPTGPGARSGSLAVAGIAGSPLTVLLSGTGVAASTPEPIVSLDPPTPFGEQTVGTASSARAVTLSNTGTAAFDLQSVTASGDFAVSHDCGGSLASGASCTLQVTFTPTGPGVRSGSLAVAGTAGSPLTVPLSGTGVGPAYSVTADLFLKIAARKSVKQGKTLAYSFVVKNRSKTRVPGVLVQGTLAEGAV